MTIRIDLAEERVWKDGEEMHLRRKPFAILKVLARRPRQIVTQDEIVEAAWGDVTMSPSLLRTHMRDLRQVLGEDVVETVVGRGYRFLLEASWETAASGLRLLVLAASFRTDSPNRRLGQVAARIAQHASSISACASFRRRSRSAWRTRHSACTTSPTRHSGLASKGRFVGSWPSPKRPKNIRG
jgi:DNA-binding winged helix-turn-helix (wHTH) protein